MSAVFYVENASPEKLAETLDELMAILSTEAAPEIERFGRWFEHFLATTGTDPDSARPVRSLTEIKAMFATKLERYAERIEQRGIEKGVEKGRAEGEQQARRDTAQAMKNRGIATDVIADVTGLSESEIDTL